MSNFNNIIRNFPKEFRKINSEEEGLVYSIFGKGFTDHAVAFNNHYINSIKFKEKSPIISY